MPWNDGAGPGAPPGGNPWGNPGGRRDEPKRPDGPGSGDRGPWGQGRRPGAQAPDLDELIGRAQAALRGVLPPGFGGGGGRRPGVPGGRNFGNRAVLFGAVAVAALWLASGFYRVQPDEQGVVLRFGAFDRVTLPGLNYHVPWPVETVLLPPVTRINRIEVGFRLQADDTRGGRPVSDRDVLQESLMLTGDENIIDIDCAVFWRVRDAGAYLFATRNPDATVKSAAESVMREVIGRTPIQPALTGARAQIETSVQSGVQAMLDKYGSGIEITQVQLQKVDPPAAVIDSFRDVQRANTEAEQMRNQADSYRNDIVPRARGDAARLTAEAEGAKAASVAEATGQGQRFLSVLRSYQASRDVTLQRLYIETMQEILKSSPSVIVDDKLQGIVPYLPLTDVPKTAGAK